MCLLACSRYHSSLICLARSGSDQLDSVALTVSRTVFPLCFYVKLLDFTHGACLSRSTEVSMVSFVGDTSFGLYSLTRSDSVEEF